MPAAAADRGVNLFDDDPEDDLRGSAELMSEYLDRYGGSVPLALAAYNAGPGAVGQYGGVPPYPETQSYIAKILGNGAAAGNSGPALAPKADPRCEPIVTHAGVVFPCDPLGPTNPIGPPGATNPGFGPVGGIRLPNPFEGVTKVIPETVVAIAIIGVALMLAAGGVKRILP